MKKIILSLAVMVGCVGLSQAGGRAGGGWRSYTVTASSAQIFVGHGFVNSAVLSTGTAGLWVIIGDTVNVPLAGSAGNVAFTQPFTQLSATQTVAPLLPFLSTTTVSAGSSPNNYWSPGQAPDNYVEVLNGLWVYKNNGAATEQVTVYYSR